MDEPGGQGVWIEYDSPAWQKAQDTMDTQRNLSDVEVARLSSVPRTIQRWYESADLARSGLAAEGVSPRTIARLLEAAQPAQWIITVDDSQYRTIDMPTAIQQVLGWCEEYGLDGLETLRELEQASADGVKDITVGPFHLEEA